MLFGSVTSYLRRLRIDCVGEGAGSFATRSARRSAMASMRFVTSAILSIAAAGVIPLAAAVLMGSDARGAQSSTISSKTNEKTSEKTSEKETMDGDAAGHFIGVGAYVAPLEPCDLPSRPSALTTRADDEILLAERAATLAALWCNLRDLVSDAAKVMRARVQELSSGGFGAQSSWDIARSEVLPQWIVKIEAANDAILLSECSGDEADVARRRAWVRCNRSEAQKPGRALSLPAVAMDADLWLEQRWREHEACVAWLAPLFDKAVNCPEEWSLVRSEYAKSTVALRTEIARSRLKATGRQTDNAVDLDDPRVRTTVTNSEARFVRWRQHNGRYLCRIDELAQQAGRVADGLLIRSMFLHAENPQIFGASAVHAETLAAAALHASALKPERAAEVAEALASELKEYLRVTAEVAESILKFDRRYRVWQAASMPFDEDLRRAVERSQRQAEAREQLMARQIVVALQWLTDDAECEIALKLRALATSAEIDSWACWRLVLDLARLSLGGAG